MINKPLLEQQAIIYGALSDFIQYLSDGERRFGLSQSLNEFAKNKNLPIFEQPETRWARYIEMVHAPVEWDGTGLPPVGVTCQHEGRKDDREWIDVRVIAHTEKRGYPVAVFEYENEVSYSTAAYFRPLRTPEQIAAEQREKAIKEMLTTCGTTAVIVQKACEDLFDSGYRKFEIVPE